MKASFKGLPLLLLLWAVLSATICLADRQAPDGGLVNSNGAGILDPELDFKEDYEFDLHLNRELTRTRKDLIEATHYKLTAQSDVDLNLFRLKIKVFASKRPDALVRLFKSLTAVDYQGDSVDVDIYLDLPRDMDTFTNKEKSDTSKIESLWPLHEATMSTIEELKWPHGTKKVHERIFNVGRLGQWLEAWTPLSPHEYALFVEDNVEVSPYFYRWLKIATSHYCRPSHPILRRIFGVSLQMLNTIPSSIQPQGSLPILNWNMPVAYQLMGSSGQVMFPGPWRDFRTWFREHRLVTGFKPTVDNLKTNEQYLKLGDDIWEQWIIRWAHDQGRFSIYANFANKECLAFKHNEDSNPNAAPGPDCHLVTNHIGDFLNFAEVPQFYDFSAFMIDPTTLPPLPGDS